MRLLNKVPSFQRQQSIFKVFMMHLPHLLDFCTKRGFVLQVSALAGKRPGWIDFESNITADWENDILLTYNTFANIPHLLGAHWMLFHCSTVYNCLTQKTLRSKMVFLTIEFANKAKINILSARDCHIFSPKGFFLAGFSWPLYNLSNVLVSGCPSLLIPTWWSLHVSNVYLFFNV